MLSDRNTAKFWSHATRGGPIKVARLGRCWKWCGPKMKTGYGGFNHCLAHRYSWELYIGPIPKGLHVLHECDNPECANPVHLFLGTHKDNMDDMRAKGRHNCGRGDRHGGKTHPESMARKGEEHGLAKLTNELVIECRRIYDAKELNIKEIAAKFRMSYGAMFKAVTRKHWKHI